MAPYWLGISNPVPASHSCKRSSINKQFIKYPSFIAASFLIFIGLHPSKLSTLCCYDTTTSATVVAIVLVIIVPWSTKSYTSVTKMDLPSVADNRLLFTSPLGPCFYAFVKTKHVACTPLSVNNVFSPHVQFDRFLTQRRTMAMLLSGLGFVLSENKNKSLSPILTMDRAWKECRPFSHPNKLKGWIVDLYWLVTCLHVCIIARLSTGACVELQGSMVDSPGKEQGKELQVTEVRILGECDSVSNIE